MYSNLLFSRSSTFNFVTGKTSLMPHSHKQILCHNFSVTNIFAHVHNAASVLLKTLFHTCQKPLSTLNMWHFNFIYDNFYLSHKNGHASFSANALSHKIWADHTRAELIKMVTESCHRKFAKCGWGLKLSVMIWVFIGCCKCNWLYLLVMLKWKSFDRLFN